jgi:hypothetical protein
MSSQESYIVVGAGPVGLLSALLLAKERGAKVRHQAPAMMHLGHVHREIAALSGGGIRRPTSQRIQASPRGILLIGRYRSGVIQAIDSRSCIADVYAVSAGLRVRDARRHPVQPAGTSALPLQRRNAALQHHHPPSKLDCHPTPYLQDSYPIGLNPRGVRAMDRVDPELALAIRKRCFMVDGWKIFAGTSLNVESV